MAQQPTKKERVKIDAPMEDIVELVRGAMEPVEPVEAEIPRDLPEGYGEPAGRDWRTLPESNPMSATDRLKQLYENAPTRENFRPSKLRTVGGAITGGLVGFAHGPEAGMKVSSDIVDKPYREAYQDWLTRTGALQKESELELEREKLETSGLSGLAALYRAQAQYDPELQGEIERRKVGAREEVQEPYREKARRETQTGREALEEIRRDREQSLEEIRQGGRETIQRSRVEISDKDRASREKIAREQILSRENIARLNRELRQRLSSTAVRNQRVPPSQQYLGRIMAEREIAQLVSDPEEFNALFSTTEDSDGRPIITMKPEKDVPAAWKRKYDQRRKEVDTIYGRILGTSFNPVGEEDEDEDQYDVEVIEE